MVVGVRSVRRLVPEEDWSVGSASVREHAFGICFEAQALCKLSSSNDVGSTPPHR